MTKYHESPVTNKAEKCSSPDNCRYKELNKGKHFDSKEEAEAYLEKKNESLFGRFAKMIKPKRLYVKDEHGMKVFNEPSHDIKAQKEELRNLTGEDRLYREADFRRFNKEDAYSRIRAEYGDDEIEKYIHHRSDIDRVAGVGDVKLYGEDKPSVLGLSFYEGMGDREGKGMGIFIDNLRKGKVGENDLTYTELPDGTGVFAYNFRSPYASEHPELEIPDHNEQVKEREELAMRLLENRKYWDTIDKADSEKDFNKLRETYLDKIKDLPEDERDARNAIAKYEAEKEGVKIEIPISPASFTDRYSMTMTTTDPIVKDMMKNAHEAHKNGTLEVGRAGSTYASGVSVFYDTRDVSSDSMQKEKLRSEKVSSAEERVSPIKKQMDKNGGLVFAMSPDVEWDGDPKQNTFRLNYSVPSDKLEEFRRITEDSGSQIFGTFTESQLRKIAQGDYSVLKKKQ